MRTILLILIFVNNLTAYGQTQIIDSSEQVLETAYIPQDLEDCYTQLDKLLPDSIKRATLNQNEKSFTANTHLTLGMSLRNNWGLWRGSRLLVFFNDKGIYHPDDMSGLIIKSYYRRLTGQEIKLEEQIKYYQDYWKAVNEPEKELFPKRVKNLEFNAGLFYDRKDGSQGCIHVGYSSESNATWLYDYHHGWAKVTKADVKKLEHNVKDREDTLLKIYKRVKQ